MRFQRCTNPDCLRPFQVNEFAGKAPGVKTPEAIICPHCGHKEIILSESVFLVHALSEAEEAAYNAQNPAPPSK
jgi:hypothetical protein